ncbi:hypothetical protein AT251_20320 [Enterovibrio nigricans]|uniref:DUF202 domain-containing protein n=1 Tax=Enterovibrio nigricans DSM 22720 TaxID=1121868 RepID=A0A1T4VV62_9GAMM|nr:hypothetical protein AT251_20320 [Enterovibrio nigricans]SKA68799.1 hypothetical protein SAMN02745132_04341 [Enterovibrio nigricans DSM 22720]
MNRCVERDLGLQRERSQLAWTRTSLTLTAAVLLLIKLSVLSTLGILTLLFLTWVALNLSTKRKNTIAHHYTVTNRRELTRKLLLSLFVVAVASTAFISFVFL